MQKNRCFYCFTGINNWTVKATASLQVVNAQMSNNMPSYGVGGLGGIGGGLGSLGGLGGPGGLGGLGSRTLPLFAGNQNITTSIKFPSLMANTLASQLNTNIGQISNTVEQQVGNNSRTVSAYLTALNGFAVYDALLVDNGGNLHEFLINPVNGKIALYLTTQALMSNMS